MKMLIKGSRTLIAGVVVVLLGFSMQAVAFASPAGEVNPFDSYTDSELRDLFVEAGVLPEDVSLVLAKVRAGELPEALDKDAAAVSVETRVQSGMEVTVYRFADGSASTFVSASAGSGSSVRTEDEYRDDDGANIRPYAVAVKDVGCASKKSSGGKVFYTQCLVKAIYLIGTASFYFDGTRASGKFTIDRVYGGACNYLLSCGTPKVQRKTSSSTRHALADMTVRGTPVKGVGWTQHLLVRVTNKGVMTAYGDYGYIK